MYTNKQLKRPFETGAGGLARARAVLVEVVALREEVVELEIQ